MISKLYTFPLFSQWQKSLIKHVAHISAVSSNALKYSHERFYKEIVCSLSHIDLIICSDIKMDEPICLELGMSFIDGPGIISMVVSFEQKYLSVALTWQP